MFWLTPHLIILKWLVEACTVTGGKGPEAIIHSAAENGTNLLNNELVNHRN